MNVMSETGEPLNKRLRPVNDRKLCEEDRRQCIQENVNNTLDIKENSLEEILEDKKIIEDSEDATIDDDKSFAFPPDEDISDMLDEVQYNGHFPTITDRYFTAYYKTDVQLPGDDICIRIHSNRICMLSLAPSHIILQSVRSIRKIDFKVSDKLDRALNKVSGKSKHGAQPLQANSNICIISCSDGQTYPIKCCMTGKLVEINEMLLEKPQLLTEPPHKGGYLAIILPNLKLLENLKQSLLTYEQYTEYITEREQRRFSKNNMESSKICDSQQPK